MFNFSASTRGTCGRSRKRAVYLAVYLLFLRFSAVVELNRISVKRVLAIGNYYLHINNFPEFMSAAELLRDIFADIIWCKKCY